MQMEKATNNPALTICENGYICSVNAMKTMDKRSEEVLETLVSSFINGGRPIGSETIARSLSRCLSPATIRNIMSGLERRGLLTHRHTSGGRLPTDSGLRYYVDKLLEVKELPEKSINDIKDGYKNTSYNFTDVCKETSRMLSRLSKYAGLVVTPKLNEIVIKHVEFIPMSSERLLGIFVGRDGFVENRVIKVAKRPTYPELEKINNYCNKAFYGLTIAEARGKILKEIKTAEDAHKSVVNHALDLSQKMFVDMEKTELFVDGGPQLVTMPDFDKTEKAALVIQMLEEKKRLAGLLKSVEDSETVNIFIGSESGYDAIKNCSLVATSYKKSGKILGTLGVIGPVRMDYSTVIPIVDCTARLISAYLDGEE